MYAHSATRIMPVLYIYAIISTEITVLTCHVTVTPEASLLEEESV
jgi:hypothetical protein